MDFLFQKLLDYMSKRCTCVFLSQVQCFRPYFMIFVQAKRCRLKFRSSTCEHSLLPAASAKEAIFPPVCDTFVNNSVAAAVSSFLGLMFYSIGLSMFGFTQHGIVLVTVPV